MIDILRSFAAFTVALAILITVHEFGHFWVARRCGVKVERFSIGFGKTLLRWRDRLGTEYVLALIPLGGYVKMLDERVANVAPELQHSAFNNKTVLQRAAIVAAGPIANFIFAIFVYWLVFVHGVSSLRPIIGEVVSGSPAAYAKITSGMELKAVDGIETPDWNAAGMALMEKIGDEATTLTLAPFRSPGQPTKTQVDLRRWKFDPDKQDPLISLGILPQRPQVEPILTMVEKGSPAYLAGLQAGDRIVSVEGQLLGPWGNFVTLVRESPGKPISLDVERQGKIRKVVITPRSRSGQFSEGYVGVLPKDIPLSDEYRILRQYSPFAAVGEATAKTWQLMKLTVTMMGKLFTGDVKLNNLKGPISIAQGAGQSAEFGAIYYLIFLALISVNLGIINLFPLPMLDGGHLLFLAIEKIKGKPVSERVQEFSYRIGSIMLVLLTGLALFNDFSRL